MAQQITLARPARLAGIGLHTGEPCEVLLLPAEADTGIVFIRRGVSIPAQVTNTVAAERCTALEREGARVMTVEHLLAALAGMQIDNAGVEVCGPEIPAADGSALPFVQLIRQAGRRRQRAPARLISPARPIRLESGGGYLEAFPAADLRVKFTADFPDTTAGRQEVSVRVTPANFVREIAPARTFALANEIAELRRRGLAAGGSEENALLVSESGYSAPLRLPQELARHKVLDLLGDLSLCGGRLRARVVAERSGHRLNLELARQLAGAV